MLHRLAGVHVHACGQDGGDVHARGVAPEHSVGDEDQPVANLQWQRLHPVAASVLHAKRTVGLQNEPARPAAAAATKAEIKMRSAAPMIELFCVFALFPERKGVVLRVLADCEVAPDQRPPGQLGDGLQ